jgi:hypothetical protein
MPLDAAEAGRESERTMEYGFHKQARIISPAAHLLRPSMLQYPSQSFPVLLYRMRSSIVRTMVVCGRPASPTMPILYTDVQSTLMLVALQGSTGAGRFL